MARCTFSNAKLLSAVVADTIFVAVNRRGYAAASQGVVSGGGGVVMAKKGGGGGGGGEESIKSTCPWVPDPVTGYYRPENRAKDIDVAELREMLLKNNIRRH